MSIRFSRLSALLLATSMAAPAAALDSRDLRVDGVSFRIVRIDLSSDRLEAHWRDAEGKPYASIEVLKQRGAEQGRRLLFATNAGIYDRQFQPLGLYIEDGRSLRPLNTARGNASAGNFSLQPNGVFSVDRQGRAAVTPTAQWNERHIDARLATQSGPMLVVDGEINPKFDEASDSRKWRSGVCAPTQNEAVFAVSVEPVSFHAFAKLFRDEIECRDALYLDGTLSRIYTDTGGYAGAPAMMVKPYAAMLAVFEDAGSTE